MVRRQVEDFAPALDRLSDQLSTVEVEAALQEIIEPLPVVHGWLHDNVGHLSPGSVRD
jgi:hypothetical protein